MRRGEWLLVLIVACPSCVGPNQSSEGDAFASRHLYAKRVPYAPQPSLHPAEPVYQPRPTPRDLTARPTMRSWYPLNRRISDRWTTIVIHHSATGAGSARSFDKNHRETRGWDALGYHFVIGNGTETPDGQVETGVRWHQQKHGAHCKTPGNYFNDHGIGICLVGDFTKSRPTPKQLRSLDELVGFLSRACSIPATRVTTHGHINHKTKCPGQYFALEPVRRQLALGTANRSSGSTSFAAQRRRRELGAR